MTRSSRNKITSMEEAVAMVKDGAHLSFSGFAHSLAPLAFVRELIRQGPKGLVLSSMGECWAADMLSGSGQIAQVRISNYMFEGYGRCRNFSRAVENGEIVTEDYSHFGITSRFLAGALGLPFMPTKVMSGTDLVKIQTIDTKKYHEYACPFTGESVVLLPAVRPDICIIHASRADREGNIQLFGASSIIDEQARASERVIVTVEEIVDTRIIRKSPEYTVIPGFLVDAVVEAPFGAHPAGMYRYYDQDDDHIRLYWEASRTQEGFDAYLQEYVFGVRNHMEYLQNIGMSRLMELLADPVLGYSPRVRGDW